MSYLDDAAFELAKIRSANDARADLATVLREDGREAEADAEVAAVAEMSFRLAGAYAVLAIRAAIAAALERDAAPPAAAPDPGQE